jgi:AcrR family transcriptional regulator
MTLTMSETTDGRLRRGDATRRTVLKRAVDIASIQGLEGLSIGQLAADLEISKSGLFAHFGAKEELQLATIRAARRIYADTVVAPALAAPAGLERIWAMSEAWLGYSRDRVFPGGCFFAKATHDFAARPGKVRDSLAAANAEWMELVEQVVEEARGLGHLGSTTDARQVAFELNAYYEGANLISLLRDADGSAYDLARRSIQSRLEQLAEPGAPRPWK